jgi:hypothetical protein
MVPCWQTAVWEGLRSSPESWWRQWQIEIGWGVLSASSSTGGGTSWPDSCWQRRHFFLEQRERTRLAALLSTWVGSICSSPQTPHRSTSSLLLRLCGHHGSARSSSSPLEQLWAVHRCGCCRSALPCWPLLPSVLNHVPPEMKNLQSPCCPDWVRMNSDMHFLVRILLLS